MIAASQEMARKNEHFQGQGKVRRFYSPRQGQFVYIFKKIQGNKNFHFHSGKLHVPMNTDYQFQCTEIGIVHKSGAFDLIFGSVPEKNGGYIMSAYG